MKEGLTYADVLIEPAYSDIESRLDIDVSNQYLGLWGLPVMSAPMDSVSGYKMVNAMYDSMGYGILHRFGKNSELVGNVRLARKENNTSLFGISIGVKDWENTALFLHEVAPLGIHSVCIDVAHGDHLYMLKTIQYVQDFMQKYGYSWHIIAGNVATATGFTRLVDAGADAIRVGIGPGSACTTRETTGVGVPQLTAVMDCASLGSDVTLIADGGIQTPGDIAKALAAGADAVMLGKMLAGARESNAATVMGTKLYRGQSMAGSNGSRGAPEGVQGALNLTGPVKNTLEQIKLYLQSSFSYVGARNLTEFRNKANFIKVSPATLQESGVRI